MFRPDVVAGTARAAISGRNGYRLTPGTGRSGLSSAASRDPSLPIGRGLPGNGGPCRPATPEAECVATPCVALRRFRADSRDRARRQGRDGRGRRRTSPRCPDSVALVQRDSPRDWCPRSSTRLRDAERGCKSRRDQIDRGNQAAKSPAGVTTLGAVSSVSPSTNCRRRPGADHARRLCSRRVSRRAVSCLPPNINAERRKDGRQNE